MSITVLETILEALGSATWNNLAKSVEWASYAVRSKGLVQEALTATEAADDPARRWLYAALATQIGSDELDSRWARVVDAEGRDLPVALLQRARLALRRGDLHSAGGLLKQTFFCECDTSTLLRAESLAKKIFAEAVHRKHIRIALLASCSTALLKTALQLLCWRDGLSAEFYEPDFGTYGREIRTPSSGLFLFDPDFVIIIENWRDVALPSTADESRSALEFALASGRDRWDRLLSALNCSIIQITIAHPSFDLAHGLSQHTSNRASYFIADLNRRLMDIAPERVLFVDADGLASKVPAAWEDPIHWSASRIYPSPEALPFLAERIVSNIRSATGLSSKVLALDLDNTLWGGVIGEDGMSGIKLGPPSPIGERYQEFHRYAKALAARGVILVAVSKNNPEEAQRVFAEHDASVLKLDDFAVFEVGWTAKSAGIRRIASTLRLGIDSFVFLDDNPVERAAVRHELPEVVVPNVSGEPAESIRTLERFQFFQTTRLTEEDQNRSRSYRALAAVASEQRSGSSDDLRESLQMDIETGPVDEVTANRVTQLINKTNQFNLTTRRYTLREVTERANSRSHWFRWYRVKDRFADHGVVGVLLTNGTDTDEWNVELWLMSCRVIGRKVEDFMFNSLALAARDGKVRRITAQYLPTAKNALVSGLLPEYGFTREGEANNYSLDPNAAQIRDLRFLKQLSLHGTST